MYNTSELERRTTSILKKGWTPTDNKNLLTFAAISGITFLVGAASYLLGYQQAQADCTHQSSLINQAQTSPPPHVY
jgi:hypothetical protein